ncbi:hypothetical protein Vafri_12000 [Volvox africanus]|uniref:Uncharacterized protein n=1 Tax=Volvox africanus TaxID=51714 RepID=A0A8J4B940_9CHLO|nr:hypothetical protein Vafri_12000 [Volvox africanus]
MVEGGRDAATDTMSCCSCVEGCGGRVVRPCPVSNVATRGSARGAIPAAAVPSGHPPATVAAAVAAAASSSSVHPTATSTAGSHSGGFRTPKRISAQTSIPSSGWRVNSSRASSRRGIFLEVSLAATVLGHCARAGEGCILGARDGNSSSSLR